MKFKFPLPLDEQLGFSLYGAFIAVGRTYKLWLDKIGLTYPQYLVLNVLWEEDDQTITGIATRLDLESSTITPLVKRLEQAGLVSRNRNPQDERQVRVLLTARGGAIRAETRALAEALYKKAEAAGMTVEVLADLNLRVTALRDAFRAP
ncbi:transcriptional regulator [Labrys miyagiensis]|uniref:Transcriptional regulator n=1 Tax=Labrys miyagiensis TaxID=346912 RepID=A0ABQ6CBA6_9HYPH|nr:MarR family transcriptional regulator [Labrys miyagiensis]GLS17089.1 transcriptional regulator [Labrys miyagiensis]